jgi:hypothetical protein
MEHILMERYVQPTRSNPLGDPNHVDITQPKPAVTAGDILTTGVALLRERGKEYDKPQGERSMLATVTAFKAVTGVEMTEEQGWLFMVQLKAVRTQQGAFKLDSYEDGTNYFALAGEAANKNRG